MRVGVLGRGEYERVMERRDMAEGDAGVRPQHTAPRNVGIELETGQYMYDRALIPCILATHNPGRCTKVHACACAQATQGDYEAVLEMSRGVYFGHDYLPYCFEKWWDRTHKF